MDVITGTEIESVDSSSRSFPFYSLVDGKVYKSQLPMHLKLGHASTPFGMVSLVFLGIDHGHGFHSEPIVFELMVFGGKFNEYMERFTSYEAAMKRFKQVRLAVWFSPILPGDFLYDD